MILLTHRMSFAEPASHLVIDFSGVLNNEMMNMISWRDGFYFGETRMLKPSRQDNMRGQAIVVQPIDGGEYHPDLKSNPCFCRGGNHVIQFFNRFGKVLIKLDGRLRFPHQKLLNRKASARVRLIAVGEWSAALLTFPQSARLSHRFNYAELLLFRLCRWFNVRLVKFDGLSPGLPQSQVEHFHEHRESHCKIDVAFGYVMIKPFDDQGHADQQQEA